MLKDSEQAYQSYFYNHSFPWMVVDPPQSEILGISFPADVAVVNYLPKYDHPERVFGLLDCLRERNIDSVVRGIIYATPEDQRFEEYMRKEGIDRVITADEKTTQRVHKIISSGVSAFIQKPFTLDEVTKAISVAESEYSLLEE